MKTKNIILSQKDLLILENVIVQKGKIVSFNDLRVAFGADYSYAEIKNRVSQLAKIGWLVRLKRGLYVVITDISTLGLNDVNQYIVSQTFNTDSYISFEAALQHYGMFDQLLTRVDAVTMITAREYTVQNTTYKFFKIKEELYFGFTNEFITGKNINIADKEKALIDMLYFRRGTYNINLVLEKLRDYKHKIDFEKLKQYAQHYGIGMIRTIGFLLDNIEIDTSELILRVKANKNSYNKLTNTSTIFDAKWRLYYEHNALI